MMESYEKLLISAQEVARFEFLFYATYEELILSDLGDRIDSDDVSTWMETEELAFCVQELVHDMVARIRKNVLNK